ncbi:hypothetical protein SynMINOS11_01653 [Synechococcus sp. Minos11]|nr:hypothetical protein SynMINOS11_01653 [Synechococcus sp. Minos11]
MGGSGSPAAATAAMGVSSAETATRGSQQRTMSCRLTH